MKDSFKGAAIELVKVQREVIESEAKVLVIFEGRDAAGKDGAIKRITKNMSPRDTRIVALGKPWTGNREPGTSNDTWHTCLLAAKSPCSIAAGTTARASNW